MSGSFHLEGYTGNIAIHEDRGEEIWSSSSLIQGTRSPAGKQDLFFFYGSNMK